jgi:hypothetical protein
MKFELSETQLQKLNEWKFSINKIYGHPGTFIYKFIPNGIGETVKVESTLVGPEYELDLTEIENW